jgi:hypothetical protein
MSFSPFNNGYIIDHIIGAIKDINVGEVGSYYSDFITPESNLSVPSNSANSHAMSPKHGIIGQSLSVVIGDQKKSNKSEPAAESKNYSEMSKTFYKKLIISDKKQIKTTLSSRGIMRVYPNGRIPKLILVRSPDGKFIKFEITKKPISCHSKTSSPTEITSKAIGSNRSSPTDINRSSPTNTNRHNSPTNTNRHNSPKSPTSPNRQHFKYFKRGHHVPNNSKWKGGGAP